TDRPRRLREDVVGEAVAGMVERAVARRTCRLERLAGAGDDAGPPFDADVLRRHPDPGEAVADELRVSERPIDRDVEPDGHVEPLDDGGAVELPRIDRPADNDARLVGRGVARSHRPSAI